MTQGSDFVEAEPFTEVVMDYFGSDDAFREFQIDLMARPERWPVIPGAAPLRKARWKAPLQAAGRRGGLRVIYFRVPELNTIVLLDVYSKSETEDLSEATKRALRRLALASIEELRASSNKETS